MRSFWEASQARGPARHMYELTDAGLEDLTACADDLRCLIHHLTGILSKIDGVEKPAPEGGGAPAKVRRRFWQAP